MTSSLIQKLTTNTPNKNNCLYPTEKNKVIAQNKPYYLKVISFLLQNDTILLNNKEVNMLLIF